ncbi:Golgin subfamily A member 1 [Armadillidium nasatum]|uniref:Golgin subfamily A member 1 n=1 Tax=Armadillidium nasatum TaxID=96803 RepID=A0A5N5SYK3_9CRUS|nr:Golgin subfamily A member 1 [Armadillidium nasatum]
MFGNLKGKLGEITDLKKYSAPQVLSSLTGSRQRSTQHTPGSQTPNLSKHSRQASDASLSGATPSVSFSTLLEQNESDYSRLEIESFRLEEELRQAKLREEELHKKFLEKDKEIDISNGRIGEQDDVAQKLFNLQENYDQLEGLGTQEISKVKHLLLNATSELEKAKLEIEEKSEEIKSLNKKLKTFEGIEDRIHVLSEEKMDLETTVAGLNQKLNSFNNRSLSVSEELEEEIKHLKEKIKMLEERLSHESVEESEKDKAFAKERESYEHKLEENRQQLNSIKLSWSENITTLEKQIQNLNEKISEDQFLQLDLKSWEENNVSLKKQIKELQEETFKEGEISKETINSLRQENERLKEDVESSKWQLGNRNQSKNSRNKRFKTNFVRNRLIKHIEEEKSKQTSEELELRKEELQKLEKSYEELNIKFSDLESKSSQIELQLASSESSNSVLQDLLTLERGNCDGLEKELQEVKKKLNVVSLEKTKLISNLDKCVEKENEQENTIKGLEDEKNSLSERIQSLEASLLDYESKNNELIKTVSDLEADFELKIENSNLVRELREKLRISEDEISEKKQMLKVQSQRITDMKKTIQRELKISPETSNSHAGQSGLTSQPVAKILPSDNQRTSAVQMSEYKFRKSSVENGDAELDTVNIEYLKHVILKFITSREYEAVQLTRAVSTLLHMTPDEENLLRETLEWKMSWFGPKPNIGKGQLAKAIPPSQ